MNRNLDGTQLTREQLIDLAIEAGMPRSKVTRDVKTWEFRNASRQLRHEMFWRGELNLNTRDVWTQPAPVTPTVDAEMVAFFTNHKGTQ